MRTCWCLLGFTVGLGLGGAAAQDSMDHWFRAEAEEIALARTAAPDAIARGATVHVLGEQGYRVGHEGTNGFHCMVRRLNSPQDVLPICFNAEAAESIMPIYQEMVVMLMQGSTPTEIQTEVATRYERGQYEPPAGLAMAYMMSAEQRFYNAAASTANNYFPHVMIYAPYLKNVDIGASREQVNDVPVPFVAFEGLPGSYIMVPTGPRGTGRSRH